MPHRPVGIVLEDILERIERIQRFVAGLGREAFLDDQKTVDSVVRNLEVIGEAANRLPEDFRDQNPSVPWRRIVGLRHRIVHEYFDVDLALVWEVVQGELPALEAEIRRLKSAHDAGPGRKGPTGV
jgi:uncharacterized protein with HEPN domain